jgi:hypothetical protein
VHGESLGGAAAAATLPRRAAAQGATPAPPSPAIVIFDRTFASLPDAATSIFGDLAGWGLRAALGWRADSASAFRARGGHGRLAARRGDDGPLRIVLSSPSDEVIAWPASLLVGVPERALHKAADIAVARAAARERGLAARLGAALAAALGGRGGAPSAHRRLEEEHGGESSGAGGVMDDEAPAEAPATAPSRARGDAPLSAAAAAAARLDARIDELVAALLFTLGALALRAAPVFG